MKIKTSGLDHVHVYVNDLTATLELLGRLFECDETLQSVVESIGSYNAQVRFPESTASPFLDMFEPMSADGAAARVIQRHGECVAMLSFRVDDLDTAVDHAVTCGLREISRVGFPGIMKQVQFHPADTAGFQLEFVQYEPDAHQRIAEIQERKRAGDPVPGLRLRASAG